MHVQILPGLLRQDVYGEAWIMYFHKHADETEVWAPLSHNKTPQGQGYLR